MLQDFDCPNILIQQKPILEIIFHLGFYRDIIAGLTGLDKKNIFYKKINPATLRFTTTL